MNHEHYDKIIYDWNIRNIHKQVKPTLDLLTDPKHPMEAILQTPLGNIQHGDIHALSSITGVEATEFRDLLAFALQSNDEVIADAFKQFLLTVKMRLPEDSELITLARKSVANYRDRTEKVRLENEERKAEYDRLTLIYNLRCQKNDNELYDYIGWLVEQAYKEVKEDKAGTIWQQLLVDVLDEWAASYDSHHPEVFEHCDLPHRIELIQHVQKRHKRWVEQQFDNLENAFYEEIDNVWPITLDGNEFITYFDEDGNPNDEAFAEYELYMNRRDDAIRLEAGEKAREQLRRWKSEGKDGFTGSLYGIDHAR